MEKEFIPYEQAVALKRLGYNEKGLAFYTENAYGDGQKLQWFRKPNDCNNDYVFISAPTFSHAFRWFRETHKLKFYIREDIWNHWCSVAMMLDDSEYTDIGEYETYREAELACLAKLIEIVKEKK